MADASALTGFSRSAVVCALSSFLATPYAAQTIGSTFRAGDARPVKRLASPAARAADINVLSFAFQQTYIGFEGPGLLPVDGEPSRGTRYIVAASVYGDEAIATAALSAVDESGTVIQSIRMMREPSGTSKLVGLMVVPDRPFRIVMTGAAVDGVCFAGDSVGASARAAVASGSRARPVRAVRRDSLMPGGSLARRP